MRADNDQVVGLSVECCKYESKPHKCPEEISEDSELKIPKNGKNENNMFELFYDTRSGEECDKKNDGNNGLEQGKSQDTAGNGGLFYMDKNVTACDMPEIVVCYKENTYHVVKDICVDEGVPVHEKFLFGEKDSVKCSSNSSQCESENLVETKSPEDRNSKLGGSELCNDHKTNQDVEEASREEFTDAESSSSCSQKHLIVTGEAKEEVTTSENVITLGGILSKEDGEKHLNNNNSHRSEEQSPSQLQENGKRSLETEEPRKAEEKGKISLETELEKTEEPRKAEEKLSSVSTTTSQEPNMLVGDSFEDDKLFSTGCGETSFSVAEAVSISGHISYSGPVVVSGRLSVRSDASTTSGRSFAFPIQNGTAVLKEWLKLRREDSKDGKRSFYVVDSLKSTVVQKLFTLKIPRKRNDL